MRSFEAALAMTIALGGSACAVAQNEPRVVLVELFTSEGCSSCPPADALLKRLNGLKTGAGQTVVGISEHVTYWNQGGWTDPFSAELYTNRQREYAQRFDLESVYTPQMVINGQQQIVGGDTPEIVRAVNLDAKQDEGVSPVRVLIEAATVQENKIRVSYKVSGALRGKANVWAVVADDLARSSVLKGENGGRTLEHVSVARGMTKVGKAVSEQATTVMLENPGRIEGQPKTGRHLILFVQREAVGQVLAVKSVALSDGVGQSASGEFDLVVSGGREAQQLPPRL